MTLEPQTAPKSLATPLWSHPISRNRISRIKTLGFVKVCIWLRDELRDNGLAFLKKAKSTLHQVMNHMIWLNCILSQFRICSALLF